MSLRKGLERYGQFIRFNLVGLVNTAVDFAIFTLLISFHVPDKLAQTCSYAAGTLNSFLLNKYWTFRHKKTGEQEIPAPISNYQTSAPRSGFARPSRSSWLQALRFAILNAANLGLSVLLLGLFTSRMGLSSLAAKAVVTVFTMLVNFAGSKLWVFRQTKSTGEAGIPQGD
ncbi:GtrA family protein [Gorillibacterium massiliense]|uniref:GtrA family protein n=1 Tax=Gorillibacterium massiliense TaxID=1280390 RepID=UPI0004AF05BE|nr:GtrA family protein [Gorillibacterium massiliense]